MTETKGRKHEDCEVCETHPLFDLDELVYVHGQNYSKQHILESFEKARKWDESLLGAMLKRDETTVGDYMQALKLKKLIEKEITWSNKNALLSEDKTKKDFFNFLSDALTSLLEDSK